MSWVLVLPLALAAFALAVWTFRLERALWTTLLAALAFGLAGYALQAHPDLTGAPRPAAAADRQSQWATVDARREMVGDRYRSGSNRLLIADALARRGQFANAAAMLRGAVAENPADTEAWLALGNALVEHAEGVLTPAAVHAYRRADETAPGTAAPGYFLGLALIREGRILDARQVWQATLDAADPGSTPDEAPRALLAERLARLDTLLAQTGALPPSPDGAAQAAP